MDVALDVWVDSQGRLRGAVRGADQPRVPAGSPEGGQFASPSGSAGGGAAGAAHSYIRENGPATRDELAYHLQDEGHAPSHEAARKLVDDLHAAGHLAAAPEGLGHGVSRQVYSASSPDAHPAVALLKPGRATVPEAVKESVTKAVDAVTGRMSRGALDRVAANVKSAEYHETTVGIAAALGRIPEVAKETGGKGVFAGGAYVGANYRQLHVVSGWLGFAPDMKAGGGGADAHVLAHELGHAIDGPAWELSRTPAWTWAWGMEVGKKGVLGFGRAKEAPLTEYARESPQEGFAEFSRLLHASDVARADVEKKFPRCAKFWKDRGLWE